MTSDLVTSSNETSGMAVSDLHMFEPTMNLRWRYSWTEKRILEQLWMDRLNGDQEWRPIPEMKDEPR